MWVTGQHVFIHDRKVAVQMHDLNFRLLRVFRTIMEAGSITRAAELVHLSQPAVSKALKQLEVEMGVRLFERVGRGLEPTAAARRLFAAAQETFLEAERLQVFAEDLRHGRAASVRVAAFPSASVSFLPNALMDWEMNCETVRLEILTMPTAQVVRSVAEGLVDCGIVHAPAGLEGQVLIDIGEIELVCAVPANHRLAARRIVEVQDLVAETLILFASDTPTGSVIRLHLQRRGLLPDTRLVTNQSATSCALVARGAGVALIDPMFVLDAVPAGIAIRPFKPGIPLMLRLVLPRGRQTSDTIRRLIDHLQAVGQTQIARTRSLTEV